MEYSSAFIIIGQNIERREPVCFLVSSWVSLYLYDSVDLFLKNERYKFLKGLDSPCGYGPA